MVLTAEQQWMVATVYEKAAADRLGVPPQQRAAFARKARWFRMLARIRAKKEAAVVFKQERLPDLQHEAAGSARAPRRGDHAFQPPKQSSFENAPSRARYETLAERLERARQPIRLEATTRKPSNVAEPEMRRTLMPLLPALPQRRQ